MKYITASMLACVFLASAAMADSPKGGQPAAIADEPDATLELSAGSVAAGIGYTWGHGELNYQGVRHKFRISGVSIVDVGVANISATGLVYHVSSLADISGNYVAASAGLTIAGGGDAVVLRNEHGAIIKLVATTAGLRFNLAASGVELTLQD